MEVRKLVLASFLLLLAACQNQKTAETLMNDKANNQTGAACPAESLVKTRFLVQYEDGHVEVIKAENDDMFVKDFLNDHYQEVKRVEYDSVVKVVRPLEDSQVSTQAVDGDWGNAMVHADAAWSQGVKGQGVIVGVVDTAVDYTHPQLASRIAKDSQGQTMGWDFIKNAPPSPITSASVEHGSHVAGIILADPTKGDMSGVAPEATFVQASFIDDENGNISAGVSAIQYAANHGAKVINASWGGNGCSEILRDTIAQVGQKGVLFVAASGNDGVDYDQYPAYSYPAVFNLSNQITVAATDALDWLTSFSNRSFTLVHIGAPGDKIRSTVPAVTNSSRYAILSGTSMAAPFVSGTAALLWSAKPNATVSQIKQAILSSTDLRSYKVSTEGRLNVEKALTEIRRIVP